MKKINDEEMALVKDILGIKTDMALEHLRVSCEAVQLFDTKQQDYGSGNISATKELGVAVRLQDKVSRLLNLLEKKMKAQGHADTLIAEINHESLDDTYLDIANYGLIGVLLRRRLWE